MADEKISQMVPAAGLVGADLIPIVHDIGAGVLQNQQLTGTQLNTFVGGSFVAKAGDTMSGTLDMGANNITNLAEPVNPQDAATKNYVDAAGGNFVQKSGDNMTGDLTFNAHPNPIWNSVASKTGAKVVAVGNAGVTMISVDSGISWIFNASGNSTDWQSVAYSSVDDLFVAVGTDAVMTGDGTSWSTQVIPTNAWTAVTYSPDLTLYVAVASSGTGDRVVTSPDGTNWTSQVSASDNNWSGVAWSSDLGLFVAVGDSDSIMTSPDGVNWTFQAGSGNGNNWRAVVWSPDLMLFAAVSDDIGSPFNVMTSPDGVNWTAQGYTPLTSVNWKSICWSSSVGLFIAVGEDLGQTGRSVLKSANGTVWNLVTPEPNIPWSGVTFDGTNFVAVSSYGSARESKVMTSADGITWAEQFSSPNELVLQSNGIIRETSARAGEVVLSGGITTLVSTTLVNTNTIILLTRHISAGTPQSFEYAKHVSTGFDIISGGMGDTSTLSWLLIDAVGVNSEP